MLGRLQAEELGREPTLDEIFVKTHQEQEPMLLF